MSDDNLSRNVFAIVNAVSFAVALGYLTTEYIIPYMKRRFFLPNALARKLGLKGAIHLNAYEAELVNFVVDSSDIRTRFNDIGGNEEAISSLQKNLAVMMQPQKPNRLRPPMGILLYGPPGCGKTMLARAVAKETGMRFLNLPLSLVLDKWVGETEKYLEALFSLARKISPCIIFIDEIDALTRRRNPLDRDWNATMKSQFLGLWDGLLSQEQNAQILIMGASNRKGDIDEAFMRRMPLQIKVSLPDDAARADILRLLLEGVPIDADFSVDFAAQLTDEWSGSNLKELCRRVELDAHYHNLNSISADFIYAKIDEMGSEFRDTQPASPFYE